MAVYSAVGICPAGFGVNEHAVTLRYSRGLALYEIHVRVRQPIVCASYVIRGAPGGTCSIELRCFGEKGAASCASVTVQ